MLARAGRQVTLLARPQHVEAIRRDGLRMETKMFDEHVRLQADIEPQAVRDAEVVCAYNAISAIAQLPYGPVAQGPGIPEVIQDLVDECLAVARAEGVHVPGDVGAAVRRIVETIPAQYSSTAQDLARGKSTEIDYLNGLTGRRGAARGIPTPVNRTLWALVKLIESKQPAATAG
jgi:2-dehydropantoate 2-reductase